MHFSYAYICMYVILYAIEISDLLLMLLCHGLNHCHVFSIAVAVKYNLRRLPSLHSLNTPPSSSHQQITDTDIDVQIKLESDKSSIDLEMFGSYSSDTSLQSEPNTNSSGVANAAAQEPSTSSTSNLIASNPTALIALQQLASISSAQCMERLVPSLPKDLLAQNESLLYGSRIGKKVPRQSTKRMTQYETNRCPLCSRVYRSQAFLNEHMRKEHSILI